MQLLTTAEINSRYNKGVQYLTNITYNKFVKDQHAVQYKNSNLDNVLLMLMYALDNWDNREGAVNWYSAQQMTAILDQIAYAYRDPLSMTCTTDKSYIGVQATSVAVFSVQDTTSIHLAYSNGILSASLIMSPDPRNVISLHGNGVYGNTGGGKLFITGTDFNVATNQYDNALLAGAIPTVFHRGLGFLYYNFSNPADAGNEYTINPAGGITITIPGFDVHDGNNFILILY